MTIPSHPTSTRQSNVFDVASYILYKKGSISTFKLQKLVYYSQAWSLVREDCPLFTEEIQAWVSGPVVPYLFAKHKGHYEVDYNLFQEGDHTILNDEQKETIDKVLDFYADKDTQWLVNLTHMEDPWKNARKKAKLSDGERGNVVITHDSMKKYYSRITII